MSRVRAVFVLTAVLALAGSLVFRLGVGTSDAAVSSTLHGTVGPGFDISLTFDDGSAVRSLPAGSYRVLVSDVATDHNFHLFGPGVAEDTSVDGQVSATWNVTFRAGATYQFVCDPHAESMFGRFDATGAGETPASGGGSGTSGGGSGTSGGGSSGSGSSTGSGGGAVAPATTRVLGTLAVAADRGKLKLTSKGRSVKTLPAGRYMLVVADSSARTGVALRRIGAATRQLTAPAFVGKSTKSVTLTPGQWMLSAGAAVPAAFRVTKA